MMIGVCRYIFAGGDRGRSDMLSTVRIRCILSLITGAQFFTLPVTLLWPV